MCESSVWVPGCLAFSIFFYLFRATVVISRHGQAPEKPQEEQEDMELKVAAVGAHWIALASGALIQSLSKK